MRKPSCRDLTARVANVLRVPERRRRITEAHAARFLDLLSRLPIRVDAAVADSAAGSRAAGVRLLIGTQCIEARRSPADTPKLDGDLEAQDW